MFRSEWKEGENSSSRQEEPRSPGGGGFFYTSLQKEDIPLNIIFII